MSKNKNMLNKMFNQQFNIEIMKDEILKKYSDDYNLKKMGENKMKKIQKFVIPSCSIALILVCGIIAFNNKHENLKNDNEEPIYNNNIVLNKIDNLNDYGLSMAGGIYDIAGGFYEKAAEELQDEYPFINNLFIFGENTKNQRIGEYRFDDIEKSYRGYYVIYTDSTEKKMVEIFFSKTMNMKPRDIGPRIVLEELEDSSIMNIPVKIIKDENHYLAFFDKNDIHFDIETVNITEEELTDLLSSIIR